MVHELERIWKEVVVTYSRYYPEFPEGTEEILVKLQVIPLNQPRLEPSTSRRHA
jgi:hypothetical protein